MPVENSSFIIAEPVHVSGASPAASGDEAVPVRSSKNSTPFSWLTTEWEQRWLVFVALLLPMKLSWTFIALIPFSLLWGWKHRAAVPALLDQTREVSAPYILLLLCFSAGSLFGINPLHSLGELVHFSYASFLGVITYDLCRRGLRPIKLVEALLAGHCVASLHSLLDSSLPGAMPKVFVGKLTESGQLALSIPLALGLLFLELSKRRSALVGLLALAMNSLLLVFAGFWPVMQHPPIGLGAAWACAAIAINVVLYLAVYRSKENARSLILGGVVIPLMLGALLVNLKRGPWAGVFIAALVLVFMYSRRLIIPIIVISIGAAVFVDPIHERLAQSSQHFFIPGGRSEIWSIGLELIGRYPLGIGFQNGAFMQEFSPRIPPELRHFHCNTLNVLVENGWIGLLLFLWWFASLLGLWKRAAVPDALQRAINTSILCGFISWQVAGTVEYNMGDKEVLFVVFLFVGIILARLTPRVLPGDRLSATT